MKGWPPRHCAACGARVDPVRDGRARRWRCSRCGFIHYGNPVPAAVAIVERGSTVLLTRRARSPWAHTWDLPGGFLEAGETAEDGVRRELREELGVETRRATILGALADRYGRGGFPILTIVYRVRVAPGAIRVADDVSEARWFARTRIPYRAIRFPSIRTALRTWL